MPRSRTRAGRLITAPATAPPTVHPPPTASAVLALRWAYFAHAHESAGRYGIAFDRVLIHLWHARRLRRRVPLRAIANIDDLVHAVACVDEVGSAWADLVDRYEAGLIRSSRAVLPGSDAIVFVRRLIAELRRRNTDSPGQALPSLRSYLGTRPLRRWLTDRATGLLNRAGSPGYRFERPAGLIEAPRPGDGAVDARSSAVACALSSGARSRVAEAAAEGDASEARLRLRRS